MCVWWDFWVLVGFFWDWVSLCSSNWYWSCYPPASDSQVLIRGMHHHAQLNESIRIEINLNVEKHLWWDSPEHEECEEKKQQVPSPKTETGWHIWESERRWLWLKEVCRVCSSTRGKGFVQHINHSLILQQESLPIRKGKTVEPNCTY